MIQEQNDYAYWLSSVPDIGDRTVDKLLEACKSPKGVYETANEKLGRIVTESQLESLQEAKRTWRLMEEYEELKRKGLSLVWRGSREYPEKLRNIPDAPFALFYKGRLPENGRLSVAIVGARDCSQYGGYVAGELGRYLGEQGIQVISGMARGIDGISQQAALEAGGSSFGVLGCGADICYPKANRALYEALIKDGGVLSAYPPGTPPVSRNFPPRNRIVSGLADAVVVIEARSKSGTLITVDMALEQGKEVYVVPGRVTDRLSDGCNRLLKQGAGIFWSPRDFVEELRELRRMKREKNKTRKESKKREESKNMGENQKEKEREKIETKAESRGGKIETGSISLPADEMQKVYGLLDFLPQSIDEIRAQLAEPLSSAEVGVILMRLCMEGYAVQVSPGQFCVRYKS